VKLGVRTNGALVPGKPEAWYRYDKASISVTTLDPALYKKTMGNGTPPDLEWILTISKDMPIKINIVLCPELLASGDLWLTLQTLEAMGFTQANLREPYGQPHIGNPIEKFDPPQVVFKTLEPIYGQAHYQYGGMSIVYWDVHYVEVESINLYANGQVSTTYPVTKGHDPIYGKVEGQEHFKTSGRVRKQWLTNSKETPS
jgi:hypothetical protein